MLSAFGIAAFSRASGAEKLEHPSSISSCLGLVHTMGTSRGGAQHSGHLQGQMDPTAQHSTSMALLAFHSTCKFVHLFPMKGVWCWAQGPFTATRTSPQAPLALPALQTPKEHQAPQVPHSPVIPVCLCSPALNSPYALQSPQAWSPTPMEKSWGSHGCSAWRREGWEDHTAMHSCSLSSSTGYGFGQHRMQRTSKH